MTIYVNGVKKQTLNIGQTINGQNPVIPGLIAHYTFDDISGTTVADETGNYPGTLINGPPTVNGYLGNGTDFDPASTQYVDCGDGMGNALGNNVSALSVSLWFKADEITSNNGLFTIVVGLTPNDIGQLYLRIGDSNLKLSVSDGSAEQQIPFTDTEFWHHCVFLYNGSKIKLYLDNIERINENNTTDLNLTGLKTIIGTYFSISRTFDGKIDQVRIFNRALTVPEIDQLFNEKVGPWIYENGRPL